MRNNVIQKNYWQKSKIAASTRVISTILLVSAFALTTILTIAMGKGISAGSSKGLISLMIAMVSVPTLYALTINTMIRRFLLAPLDRLTKSVSLAESNGAIIFGHDRDDEIGDLARTIRKVWDKLGGYNSDLIHAEEKLDRNEHLLHTVNKMSGVLLTAENEAFEVSLHEGMELLADCLGVDRINIWQNELIDGTLHYSLRFKWASDTAAPQNSVPFGMTFPYGGIPGWEALFLKGGCINSALADLSPIERERLGLYGIKSLFVVPVFLRDYFWGFVSFDDCRKERTFTEAEIGILRSGSHIIVSSLNRNAQATEVLKMQDLRDTMMQTVNNIATLLLQSETDEFESVLRRCMSMIGAAVDADRVYIWKNHIVDDRLVSSQLCEWSEAVPPQQNTEYAVNIPYDNTMPNWEDTLAKGHCVNGIVREMPAEAQAQLLPQGIVSILIVPVFLRDEFWGFVGFDDCINERVFSESEETILRSASLLIANALLRNKMTLGIRDAAAQLELALGKAQAASSAKSNFLSNMSHEMRTPMNAIIGMTMIGKSALDDIEKKDYAFEKIEEASKHLLGVINDILDMSKIEANKFELFSVEFDFEKLLDKVTDIINFRVEEKHQQLSFYIDPDIPQTLAGDDQRLSQVLTNLLSNAVKFTPERGSIQLSAHFLKEENGLCTIQVAVADTGIGISAEQQARLFTSFEQAETSTSRKFGGTGLGLAICKSIVKLMGGTIWVESELGSGSTFVFTVQLEKHTGLAKPAKDSDMVPEQEERFPGRRILLAEDLEINREIVAAMMEPLCLEIDFAENGKEALRMFSARPEYYDLIFMDLQMPEMDGFEAARRIRAIASPKAAEIPIIAMTANVFKEDIEKCLKTGMNGHVGKPLDIGEIVQALRVYLRQ